FHPQNPDTIYTVRKDGMVTKFYRSLNGGNSFTQMTNGWPVPNTGNGEHQERTEIAVTPAAPNNIYALATGSANGGSGLYGVYKSTDLGNTWTFTCCGAGPGGPPNASNMNLMGWSDQGLDDGGQYYYDLAFAVSPYNKDSMWVCGVNLWVSANEGSTFVCPSAWSHSYKPQYVHADIHDLHYMESTGELWLSGDGGIFYSEDRGANFQRRNVGILGTDFWGFGQGHWYGDVMLGGAYHNGTMLKEDEIYLNGWICTDGGDGVGGYVNPGYDRQVYSWFNIKDMQSNRLVNPVTRDYYRQPNSTYITGASSDLLFHPNYYGTWYSGSGKKLYRTQDNGFTFQEIHDFGVDVAAMDLCVTQPNVIYACTFPGWWDIKRIYRSDDAGETWTEITPPENILNHPNDDWVPYDIAVSPTDPMKVFIVRTSMYSDYPGGMSDYLVYKSINGGASWTNISGQGLSNEYPTGIVYQKGTNDGLYLGTRRAVYYKNNSMTRWELINAGLPARIHSAKLAPWYRAGKLRNATDQSVWEAPFFEPSQPIALPAVHKEYFFCQRDTAYFTDLSVLNETNASWSWTFQGGTPATSTIRNPKVVYKNPGVYDVTLIVHDIYGSDTAVMQRMVTVDNRCQVDTTAGGKLHLTAHPDFVKVEDLNLTGNTFTFTAWVKPNGIQSEYTGIVMNDGTAAGMNFRESNNTLGYHWPGGEWWYDSNLTLPANEWSYVAMVVQPASVTLYVNGFSVTHTKSIQSVTLDNMRIGSYQGWDSRHFKGDIDEVCIWSRALSQDEVRLQRHLTKNPSSDPTLKAYYQFDKNINSGFIIDKVNGKDGVLNSGATVITSDAPVGSGTSQIVTISSSGQASFNSGGDMDITFGTTHPNGKIVVSHLRPSPDTMPANLVQQGGYYLINNYGANQSFSSVAAMTFTNCGSVSNDMASTINFDLFKRGSNATGPVWSEITTTNVSPTASLSSAISMTGLTGITSFSQFIVMRNQVPSGIADIIMTTTNQPDPVVTGGESISLLMYSDHKGLKLPVLNAATINSLGIPSPGQLAFLTDSLAVIYFNGSQWMKLKDDAILQTEIPVDPNTNLSVSIPGGVAGDAYLLNLANGFVKLPVFTSTVILTIDDPAAGMIVFDSTIGKIRMFNGSQWQIISSVSTPLPVSPNPSVNVTGMAVNQNFKYASSVLEISPVDGKALQLPVVRQELIFDPVAGVICYDPLCKCLMVYDGIRWNQIL
ncbi:MAG: PKD domain-containing protein, partial [Bacteroidota bacterium]|nr:PKD domain-containing protein [Bacteroidota bacterium]